MKNNWILWTIIGVVGFVVVAAGTVAILTMLNPKHSTQDDQKNATQQTQAAADAVLSAFTTQAATNEALGDIAVVPAQEGTSAPLYATTGSGEGKAVQLSVQKYVTLRKVEGLTAQDVTRVGDAVGAFLTEQGMEKKALQGSEVLGVYAGDAATCTVRGSVGAMAVTLACEDEAFVSEQATLVETLLAQAPAYEKNYSVVRYLAATSEDKANSLAQLTVVAADTVTITNSLLYTAEGTTWTFVEDSLNTPLGQSGGGKVALGEAGQKLLQDNRYEPLLMQLLTTK